MNTRTGMLVSSRWRLLRLDSNKIDDVLLNLMFRLILLRKCPTPYPSLLQITISHCMSCSRSPWSCPSPALQYSTSTPTPSFTSSTPPSKSKCATGLIWFASCGRWLWNCIYSTKSTSYSIPYQSQILTSLYLLQRSLCCAQELTPNQSISLIFFAIRPIRDISFKIYHR